MMDPGEDADDNGDASNIEDYHNVLGFDATKPGGGSDNDDDMEDFQACKPDEKWRV